MAIIDKCVSADFNAAGKVNWFGANNNHGDPADLRANAYRDDAGFTSVTIVPAARAQAITVSTCSAAGLRCNIEDGTGLLLADNQTGAPLFLRFPLGGVSRVGAFLIAQAPLDTPFTPQIWVEKNNSGNFIHISGEQGATGDIFTKLGDSVAPFIGVAANARDRITAVKFDAIHPTTLEFTPIGIGYLYCMA